MSIQDWGAIGEIVGAIGVLATLVYLALQVRHSTEVSKVASYHAAVHQIVEAAKDPEFALLLEKIKGGETLSTEEETRSQILAAIFIYGHEILLHLFEKRQVNEALWENVMANNLPFLQSRMINAVLQNRPGAISKRLLTYVEKHGNST